MGGKRGTPADRFWRAVDTSGECWTWTLARNERGYGQFGVSPTDVRSAHRFSWEVTHGAIPDGLCVLHRCDNPPCVRPSHLFLGTRADNWDDAHAKGRDSKPPIRRGLDNHGTVLTSELVGLIQGDPRSARLLAHELGIGLTTVKRARRGDWWGAA